MKTVPAGFLNARLQPIPPHVEKTITLSEHQLDGTLLNEYDISSYLKGGLPLIGKDVEKEMNKFVVGEATLKFHDPNKYLNAILEQSNRKFGLQITLNFENSLDTREIVLLDQIDDGGTYQNTCGDGTYIYAATNDYLRAYALEDDTLVLKGSVAVSGSEYDVWCDGTYIYLITNANGYIYAFTFDGTTFTQKGSLYLGGIPLAVWGDGTYLYVTFQSGVLKAFDFDGTTFTQKGSISTVTTALDVWGDGTYIYVANYTRGLTVYSFDGTNFTEIDNYSNVAIGDVNKVHGDGTYIYAACSTGFIAAFSFDGASLSYIAQNATGDTGLSVRYESGYVFGGGSANLYVLTFDGSAFTEIDFIAISDFGLDIWADGYNFYLANRLEGLSAYEMQSIFGDPLVLFDGMIDIQRISRFGRNTLALTAQTWEKEFEHHNAELVHNNAGIYFRFITGVTFNSLSGGTVGAKKLNYTYKTIMEGGSTVEEFGLSYEGGEEFLFREAGTYNLTGASGQIINLTISDVDNLPKKDAEDTLVVSSVSGGGTVGFWYESKTLSELVGYLLNTSNFNIPVGGREINIDITPLLSLVWQFDYFWEEAITSSEIHCCVEDNPTDTDNILTALGVLVFRSEYDSTNREVTFNLLMDVTATFASATRVEKILRLPNGDALVVCTSGTKSAGAGGWCVLEGIMQIQNDGTIVRSWNKSTLLDGKNLIAGTSVELMNYTRSTGEIEDRNGFYWMQWETGVGENYFYISFIDIDYNPATIYTSLIFIADLPGWVAPNAVYHRLWNDTTPDGSDWAAWFLEYDEDDSKGYIHKKWSASGGGEHNVELTYCTETTINSIRAIRADNSRVKFHLITSEMASNKQYVFECTTAPGDYPNINSTPVSYFLDHPVFLPDIYRAVAFEMDSADVAHNLVQLRWISQTDNPTIENIGVGFNGWTYSPHPVCYLDDEEVYFGVAELGSQAIAKFFICSNITDAIIPIADFTGMNVREALNELASAFNCTWKRMERDKVRFVSRGTYIDTFTLDNNLYKSNWQEVKTKPYIGVEIKNPLYSQYEYRYPENFNSEEGEVFRLNNRFALPVNGPLLAKINGDWFMAIRTEAEVEGFFLIELEEFDKIEWKKYLYDGTPDEQVDCVLTGIAYDDKTKLTRIRMVGIDSYPFKKVKFRPRYFA